MKEIDERRARLDATLAELEKRLPPLAHAGRRALQIVLGGGAGSGVLLLAGKRLLKRRAKAKKDPAPAQQVTVKVIPGGAVAAAVAIAAIWGVVRMADAWARAQSRDHGENVVPLPRGSERRA
ncbi:MAG: hypothetical protein ABR552_09890 [Actinomycetota bacterium]